MILTISMVPARYIDRIRASERFFGSESCRQIISILGARMIESPTRLPPGIECDNIVQFTVLDEVLNTDTGNGQRCVY